MSKDTLQTKLNLLVQILTTIILTIVTPNSVFYFLFLCLLLFSVSPTLSASNEFPKTGYISLLIHLDQTTHQYYTPIGVGTPRKNINFAIDLSTKFLWFDCDKHFNSSSYSPFNCHLPKCPQSAVCFSCDGTPRPGCLNDTCGVDVANPFAVDRNLGGFLGQDFVFTKETKFPRTFVSACADSDLIDDVDIRNAVFAGLNKSIKGILGLGRSGEETQFTLPFQISSTFNVPPKFTLCLPSQGNNKNGQLFIGGRPSSSVSVSQVGFDSSNDDEYFIGVNSITINEKPLKLRSSLLFRDDRGNGGTKLSTASPYTVLHHSIYIPFVRDFVKAAKAKNIKKVKKVAPFGACFDANTIGDREVVPVINLEMDGRFGKVKYDISGHKSLVEVKKGVLCLAFVDGGKFIKTGVVLGGLILEDRVLEFDLSTSVLSFSSSLSLQNKSCSDPASL